MTNKDEQYDKNRKDIRPGKEEIAEEFGTHFTPASRDVLIPRFRKEEKRKTPRRRPHKADDQSCRKDSRKDERR